MRYMARKPSTFSSIFELRERYVTALHGKESLIATINAAEVPEHVYNSNAIENSTLTLEETEKILLQIDLERFVNEREIFEAKNLARVVEYMDATAKEREMSVDMILLLHRMLIGNIRDDVAGRFRRGDEWVRVGSHIGADPKDIEKLINTMLTVYHARVDEHIVKRVARCSTTIFLSVKDMCQSISHLKIERGIMTRLRNLMRPEKHMRWRRLSRAR